MKNDRRYGFALPTVLLASTILLIVLTVASAAAASINSAVGNVYYQQVAREAAESGLTYARYCYNAIAGTATSTQWPKSGTLTQSTDCYGAPKSGQNCSTSPGTILCGMVDAGTVRTQFSVPPPSSTGGAASYTLHATGTTQLLRSSSHAVYDSFTATLSQQVSVNLYGIASGNDTTCSIQGGQLYCWGKNDSGQVGNGTTNSPVTVPYHVQGILAGKYVQYVATGISHTCAVAGNTPNWADGNQVYCWGDNSLGQLGTGTTTSSTVPVAGAYMLPAGRAVGCNAATPDCIPISARDHTCIIAQPATGSGFSSAVEYCWGQDANGQAGQQTSGQTSPPTPDANGNSYKTNVGIALVKNTGGGLYYFMTIGNVSGESACGINGTALGQTSGALYCWGGNYYGELGNGTRSVNPQLTASAVNVLTGNVTQVATNNGRACALMSSKVYCWGENGIATPTPNGTVDYRLDSGSTFNTSFAVVTPTPLISSAGNLYGSTITDFAITDWDTCVVTSGKVYCSGYNDLGQLGQGNTNSYNSSTGADTGPLVARGSATSPTQVRPADKMEQVQGALAGQTVTSITSGNNHFCAITVTHLAYCWGDNSLGQLGNGTTNNSSTPTQTHVPATIIF